MRSLIVVLPLAFVAQAHVEEFKNKSVDKSSHQALKVWPLRHTDLDNVILGTPAHVNLRPGASWIPIPSKLKSNKEVGKRHYLPGNPATRPAGRSVVVASELFGASIQDVANWVPVATAVGGAALGAAVNSAAAPRATAKIGPPQGTVNVFNEPLQNCGPEYCTYSRFDSGLHEACVNYQCVRLWEPMFLNYRAFVDISENPPGPQHAQPIEGNDIELDCSALPSQVLEPLENRWRTDWRVVGAEPNGTLKDEPSQYQTNKDMFSRAISVLCQTCFLQVRSENAKQALLSKCKERIPQWAGQPSELFTQTASSISSVAFALMVLVVTGGFAFAVLSFRHGALTTGDDPLLTTLS